jgi:hypothetical protein
MQVILNSMTRTPMNMSAHTGAQQVFATVLLLLPSDDEILCAIASIAEHMH